MMSLGTVATSRDDEETVASAVGGSALPVDAAAGGTSRPGGGPRVVRGLSSRLRWIAGRLVHDLLLQGSWRVSSTHGARIIASAFLELESVNANLRATFPLRPDTNKWAIS